MEKGDTVYFRQFMGPVRKAEVFVDHGKSVVVFDPNDSDYLRSVDKKHLISEQEYLTSVAVEGLLELSEDILKLRSTESKERLVVIYDTLKETMNSLNKKDGEDTDV